MDSDANARHRITASSGAKVAKVVLMGVAGVAGGAVVGCVLLNPVGLSALSCAGFTSLGPAAGSPAALLMSSIATSCGGGVKAGSLYALVQSTAMTGGGGLLTTVSTAVGGFVGGLGSKWLTSKLIRPTTSSSRGYDPVCTDEEKSKERCFACGTPFAPATTRAF